MSSLPAHFSRADRDLLIERHRDYVRALAVEIGKSLPPHVEFDELVACGNLGLVESAERYDPSHRVSFRTFAYYRIRGAIFDALRKMGPLTRADYARVRAAAGANDLLQSSADDERADRGGAAPGVDDEIGAAQAAIDALIPVYLLSLDGESVGELADPSPSALEGLEQGELVSLTRQLVAELPAADRQLIEDIYYRRLTISEVAVKLGASKSWGSRLHARAISRLRESMVRRGLLNGD